MSPEVINEGVVDLLKPAQGMHYFSGAMQVYAQAYLGLLKEEKPMWEDIDRSEDVTMIRVAQFPLTQIAQQLNEKVEENPDDSELKSFSRKNNSRLFVMNNTIESLEGAIRDKQSEHAAEDFTSGARIAAKIWRERIAEDAQEGSTRFSLPNLRNRTDSLQLARIPAIVNPDKPYISYAHRVSANLIEQDARSRKWANRNFEAALNQAHIAVDANTNVYAECRGLFLKTLAIANAAPEIWTPEQHSKAVNLQRAALEKIPDSTFRKIICKFYGVLNNKINPDSFVQYAKEPETFPQILGNRDY